MEHKQNVTKLLGSLVLYLYIRADRHNLRRTVQKMRGRKMATEHSYAVKEFLRKLDADQLGGDVMLELHKLTGEELEELAHILCERSGTPRNCKL